MTGSGAVVLINSGFRAKGSLHVPRPYRQQFAFWPA